MATPRSVPAPSRRLADLAGLMVLAGLVVLAGAPLTVDARPITVAAGGATLRVIGSPLQPGIDGPRGQVTIELDLATPASVDVVVRDHDGRRTRVLARARELAAGAHAWQWRGRDQDGRSVPEGPYRAQATLTADDGRTRRLGVPVTVARRAPYPVRPGAIVVAVDAGHGGQAGGAVWRGLAEDDVNLDISLRLEAMLEGAGVGVVMTRRTDRLVSPHGLDLDGDGRYRRSDELIARNDIANLARADVHIAVHNNATRCHCVRGTEVYTHPGRSGSPEGLILAKATQSALLDRLRDFSGRGWRPKDLGVKSHHFQALRPYHRRKMPRPSLQATILGESLFIDHPSENRLLRQRRVRTAIAAAYFDGIARLLARRRHGLRYQVLDAPATVPAGTRIDVDVRLTATGRATSRGWRLVARVVPAVFRYDGRPRRGAVVAGTRVPDGVAPGESVEVSLDGIPMPKRPGRWLVKLDVELPGGASLAGHGVVGPQLRVRTVRG